MSGLRKKLAGVGFAALLALAVPAGAQASITISPLAGSPDAMPATQVSILGTPASNVASVSVTGSVSGEHEGVLRPYSSASGASFVPSVPFQEGEQVQVEVALHEGGTLQDNFTVAHLGPPEGLLSANSEKPEDQEHFRTAPELRPPKLKVNQADPSLAGDFFLDPLPAPTIHVGSKLIEFEPVGPNGLMLLDPQGRLVWWNQMPTGNVASMFETVTYEGKPAVAWWQGPVTEDAYGQGEGVIANQSYETVAHVKAGNGQEADIHELQITPAGQAWIDTYQPVCDPVCNEADPPVLDTSVQEIDIHTGLVMWEWNALGHVPTSETEVEPTNGVFDPFHLNSIQPLPGEKVLISMRDTSGIYELDQHSGSIIWQIAGKKSSFTMKKGTRFYFQHDARLYGPKLNRLSLFDDEAGPPVYGPSRGLVLAIGAKGVHVVRQYPRPGDTVAPAEGSMQVQPGGEALVGFGATPYFSEFSKSGEPHKEGRLLFDAELPQGDGTYRVLRSSWSGQPHTVPALVAEREGGEVSLYASWNGATALASWQVLAGESAESLAPAGTFSWSGFETHMTVASGASTFEVRALDGEGHVLATSAPVQAP
jgi:Arylsulfotransferase (ASST)